MKSLSRWFVGLLVCSLVGWMVVACSSAATPTTSTSGALTEVSVVMGYIPNVQFTPWYVAEKKGYFAAAGIKIKYNWGFELDGLKLVGANQSDFAMLGGDQVIQARGQDIPLVYVMNYYNAFPISIFSLKEKNITSPKDLVGKKVGLSGFYGATYTGWRALLYAAGIKESDVQTQDIGFTQVAAVTQGLVDAAAGYSNNEPVQLALAGKEINVIPVSDYSKLVGIGLVTNDRTLAEKPEIVNKVVGALLRGIQDTIKNPDEALNIAIENLPEAGGQNAKTSQAVLNATIKLMTNSKLGFVDPANWTSSYKFMKDAGFVKTDFDVSKAYTNKHIP
ncbi:MAG: ABC transporter substrate-binding protein [Chloroflexi bacterium]|nr:ABC transporter substrate-binding protein [Chloroflexota bacterium]